MAQCSRRPAAPRHAASIRSMNSELSAVIFLRGNLQNGVVDVGPRNDLDIDGGESATAEI